MRLMIADDEPYIVKGLAAIINELNTPFLEITEAYDGFDALAKMGKEKPDLLITDIKMPEMNGFEVIKNARSAGLCDRFVILTGFAEFEYVREAMRAQVIDYLLKPIQREELETLLLDISQRIGAKGTSEATEILPHTAVSAHPITAPIPLAKELVSSNKEPEPLAAAQAVFESRSAYMRKVLAYIHQQYASQITLEAVASEVGMHPNYLSSIFRKEMGVTYLSYLTNFRIEQSKRLLRGGYSISDIALMTGFADKRHFFKVFKKVTGITPGQYRETEKAKDNLNNRHPFV